MNQGRYEVEETLDGIVRGYLETEGPGASVLVARGDEVLLNQGYGLADLESMEPVTPETRFVIASVTKQFTAMAVMILEERDLISLDDTIEGFFPQFPPYTRQVTVRQLITHTSGIREYLTRDFWEAAASGQRFTQKDVLDLILSLGDTEFAPGSRWSYSNSGYIMLGALVEKLSGRPFSDFVKEEILEPVGMESSVVGTTDEHLPGQARGYSRQKDGSFEPTPYGLEAVGWADGNLISTTGDLKLWADALYTDLLLPYPAMARAFVPCRPLDPSFSRYGLGHLISERRGVREVHHGGGTVGYVSGLTRFTDERLTIVLLSNLSDLEIPAVAGSLADQLLQGSMAPLKAVTPHPEVLRGIAGTYCDPFNPDRLEVEVRVEGNALSACLTGWGREERKWVRLVPVSPHRLRLDDSRDYYLEFLPERGSSSLRLLMGGQVLNLGSKDDGSAGCCG